MNSENLKFGVLETSLRDARSSSRKILVPYITGGLTGWIDAIRAAAANGADAVEIGIPFSDPVMDGPVIQQASEKALRDGATPTSIFNELRNVDVQIPLIVMCYYNTVFRAGHEVGLLGVTGERTELATTAISMATRLKKITDVPVLVGVGVSNAQQAQQACAVADGVIQGASVVRRLLDEGPDAVGNYVAEVRAAIDSQINLKR